MENKTFIVSIGNCMICSDIWHNYHESYFEIVIRYIVGDELRLNFGAKFQR